jgi:hypothetical protein
MSDYERIEAPEGETSELIMAILKACRYTFVDAVASIFRALDAYGKTDIPLPPRSPRCVSYTIHARVQRRPCRLSWTARRESTQESGRANPADVICVVAQRCFFRPVRQSGRCRPLLREEPAN